GGATGAVRPTLRAYTYVPSSSTAQMNEFSTTSSPRTQSTTVTGDPDGIVRTVSLVVLGSARTFVSPSAAPCQTARFQSLVAISGIACGSTRNAEETQPE